MFRAYRPFVVLTLIAAAFACSAEPRHLIEAEADRRVESSDVLLKKLLAGKERERVRAAEAIGRIQSATYLDALIAALDDDAPPVRHAALFAIGQLGLVPHQQVDPQAAEAIRPFLSATVPETVHAALNALGKVASVEAADDIQRLFAHEDPRVRAEAALALFRLRFAPVWRKSSEEPPVLSDDAVGALLGAMTDPNPGVRLAATYAFSRYPEPRATAGLVYTLDDQDPLVRLFAARGLGLVAGDDEVPPLIHRLFDGAIGVRIEAVGALRRARAFGPLEPQVEDPSFHVRAAVAEALADASSTSSLDKLRGLADDPSVTVRVAAIDAFSIRLGPDALDAVKGWAGDDDWRIRAAGARAAARAGAPGLEIAEAAFEDQDIRVRTAVLDGLKGSTIGDSIVTAALAQDDLALRGTAVGLVAEREQLDRIALLERAYDASPGEDWIEVRESIADVLVDLESAEELLRRIASGDDAPSVRAKAAAGLEEPPPVVPGAPIAASPRLDDPIPRGVHVDLETRHGTMRIRLMDRAAPVHVAAFLERVDVAFYDGLIWHRVVPNFVIQGGDPRGDGWGSDDETLRDEINPLRYMRGSVGMPKAGKDTGGCQLFITHVPTPHLDGNYTIFGQVVLGLEVIDAIEVGDEILGIRRVE